MPVAFSQRSIRPPLGGPSLASWVSVRSAVAAGTRKARLLCLGDSLTAGLNSTANGMGSNARSLSYPAQMSFVGAPSHSDAFFGDANSADSATTVAQYDSRISLGAGWQADTTDSKSINGNLFVQASTASTSFAFAPALAFDNFTVWYEKFSGSPQYTVNIDGGSSLGTLAANGSPAIGSASFSVSLGTHTINVVANSTATGKIFGVEAWASTTPKIQIVQAGASDWQASDWVQNNSNPWDPLPFAQSLAPDLTLVCLGKNEQDLGTSPTVYQVNLWALTAGIIAAGSPVVIFGPPLSLPTQLGSNMSEANQLAFENNMRSVASQLGCTFYSLTQSRANWNSYANANAAGFMAGMHCTPAGYLDMANALLTVIG